MLGPAPFTTSRGEEMMCSEPGDTSSTEGDGGDLAANEAGTEQSFPLSLEQFIVPAERNHTQQNEGNY